MRHLHRVCLSVLLAAVGCNDGKRGSIRDEVATAPPDPPVVPDDDGPPTPIKVDGTRLVPAVKLTRTSDTCAPLAALPGGANESQKALRPIAEALRKVSCDPSVFGMPKADAIKALKLETPVNLELYRQAALVRLAEPVAVGDVVAAFGIEGAKMRAKLGGMRMSWELGAGEDGARPKLWGLGELAIELDARPRPRSPDAVTDLPEDAQVVGALRIVMPYDLLVYDSDSDAAAVVTNALIAIANDPKLLEAKPAKLQARLGERFSLSPYSVGSKGNERQGFSIRPRRTEVVASELAEALRLPSPAHEAIDITDTNPHRLASNGETEFVWQGLELEVELDKRTPKQPGLAGWVVTDIDVLPAP